MVFIREDFVSAQNIVDHSCPEQLEEIIKLDPTLKVGDLIFNLASKLVADYDGVVPTTKDDLLCLDGIDDTVATLQMQHVFGSSDILVTLHARKILTALDMLDWEEVSELKSGVKMADLPHNRVKKSLKTWLPKGAGLSFQDTVESLGAFIESKEVGNWGTLRTIISMNFTPKDKKVLDDMVFVINQFYEATKPGGKKTVEV